MYLQRNYSFLCNQIFILNRASCKDTPRDAEMCPLNFKNNFCLEHTDHHAGFLPGNCSADGKTGWLSFWRSIPTSMHNHFYEIIWNIHKYYSREILRTASSIDLISHKIQILGGKVLLKNLGFKSPLRSKIFLSFLFLFKILHAKLHTFVFNHFFHIFFSDLEIK